MAQTSFLETEILLAVLNEDYLGAIDKLSDGMTLRERVHFLESLSELIQLINVINQAEVNA